MSHSPDLRIVLIGKTGVGKSAVGNTILGEKNAFKAQMSASSVTETCEKKTIEWNNRNISIIDTPGILETNRSPEMVTEEILRCIQYSSPGPHVFLLVLRPGRFTAEDQNSVEALQELFGKTASNYMIVLFTHGDGFNEQQTIHDYVLTSKKLQDVLQRCRGRFHLFNNMSTDRRQIDELMKKIDDMVAVNGNECYTNDMFKEADRVITQQPEPREVAEKKTYDFSFLKELKDLVILFLKLLGKA